MLNIDVTLERSHVHAKLSKLRVPEKNVVEESKCCAERL